MADSYVYFSENSYKFEEISKVTNVFFDETNKQLFTVRSGGVMGVQVQGPTADLCHSFRMQDKGPVIYIKLSLTQTVLAVQRSKLSVDFFNLNGQELEKVEYSLSSRKGTEILGFVWSNRDEIVIITNQGVELFEVSPEKRSTKSLSQISANVIWYEVCTASKFLVLACGPTASSMQPISYIQSGKIVKTPKFQIDIPITSTKGILQEREVVVAQIYGQTCILVLRSPPRPPGASPPLAQILVYTMHKTSHTVRRTHTLQLEFSGKVALNVVENLILVHHQPSRSTILFDTGGDNDSREPKIVKPFLPGISIQPFIAQLPGREPFPCQLYSPHWVVFRPNIIIDAKIGFLWYVEIDLKRLISASKLSPNLVALLLRRKPDTALPLLIDVLQTITNPLKDQQQNLLLISEVFDTINQPYRRQLNELIQHQMASPVGGQSVLPPKHSPPDMIVIDEKIMFSNIFLKFPEKKGLEDYDAEFGIKVILEYVRSLADAEIPIRELNMFLINFLIDEEHGFSRLHQLLQYRVLTDSKQLACALISLEDRYPPALQISLDMLKRLGTADDEIIEILLHPGKVITTLRFAVSVGLGDKIPARKFLEAAQSTSDRNVFFSVYKFFELRNLRLRGSTGFMKGELCDTFVSHFRKLFVEEMSEMEENNEGSGTANNPNVQPRPPNNLSGALRYCIEANAGSTWQNQNPHMDDESRKFLSNALSSMTNDVILNLRDKLFCLQNLLKMPSTSEEDYEDAFDDLLDMVDKIDFAIAFHKIGGFELIEPCLISRLPIVRLKCCQLIGVVCQNNPYCQEVFIQEGFFKRLMDVLKSDPNTGVRIKALFAVACVIRENVLGFQSFNENDGCSILKETLQAKDEKLKIKTAFLIASVCGLFDDKKLQGKLTEMGFVEKLILMISQHKSEYNILEPMLCALLAMVKDCDPVKIICRREDLKLKPMLLSIIERAKEENKGELNEIIEYSTGILQQVSPIEENSSKVGH